MFNWIINDTIINKIKNNYYLVNIKKYIEINKKKIMSSLKAKIRPDIQEVFLPPIADSTQIESSLEPQYIRKRSNNNSTIYLDSSGRNTSYSPNNLILSSGTSVLARKIKRFKISGVYINYNTPNVNVRNNTINFYANGDTSILYTATVTESYYTFASFQIALQAVLNGAGSGLIFTVFPDASNQTYTIFVGIGTSFAFDINSPMIKKGRHLVNLPAENPPRFDISVTAGTVSMFYTRYIDFRSSVLNEYNKNPSADSKFGEFNKLFRFFLGDEDKLAPFNRFVPFIGETWTNYETTRNIATTDIQVLDEFNEFVYIPTYSYFETGRMEKINNSDYIIEITTEL